MKVYKEIEGNAFNAHAIDENVSNNIIGQHEFEGGDNCQHTQYITWPGQNADDDQKSVLQSVNGNRERKVKRRVETYDGIKKRSINLAALRMIVQQGAEKLQ